MPISSWSTVAIDNGSALGIDIAENCEPKNINNALREMMAQIKGDWLPSGTVTTFVQTTAPTGWTKSTAHDNKALRIVSGAAGSGGTVAFTTAFASQSIAGTTGSHVLTESELPTHHHFIANGDIVATSGSTLSNSNYVTRGRDSGSGSSDYTLQGNASAPTIGLSGDTGSSAGHTHSLSGATLDLAVMYVDVIICTKN